MKSKKSLYLAMTCALLSGAVHAQIDPYATVDISKIKVPAEDKNGDGCIEKSEVNPGSQMEKRFSTRDTNGDGKLCKDEYFAP